MRNTILAIAAVMIVAAVIFYNLPDTFRLAKADVKVVYSTDALNEERHRDRRFRGFEVIEFATGISNPTALIFDSKQRLFVAQENGDILYFVDRNKDANIESRGVFATGFEGPRDLGLNNDGVLYVSHAGGVSLIENPDFDFEPDFVDAIITDLPQGLHENQAIAISDTALYIAQGASTRTGSPRRDPLEGAILQSRIDGFDLRAFATGFFDPRGLAFDPLLDRLYATERSRDDIKNTENRFHAVNASAFYGWPECSDDAVAFENATVCDRAITESVVFPHEWGIGQIAVYRTSQTLVERFPIEMQGDIFVVFEDKGTVEALRVADSGATDLIPFAAGFARPIDIIVGPIGSLFVADYEEGTIFKLRALWD